MNLDGVGGDALWKFFWNIFKRSSTKSQEASWGWKNVKKFISVFEVIIQYIQPKPNIKLYFLLSLSSLCTTATSEVFFLSEGQRTWSFLIVWKKITTEQEHSRNTVMCNRGRKILILSLIVGCRCRLMRSFLVSCLNYLYTSS